MDFGNEIRPEETRGPRIFDFHPDKIIWKEEESERREKWEEMERNAVAIIKELQEKGYKAYIAGGAVRDYLQGKIPKDFDIVTSAGLEELEKVFPGNYKIGADGKTIREVEDNENCGYYKSETAKKHGILNIKKNGHEFEIAVFRKDVYNEEDEDFDEEPENTEEKKEDENIAAGLGKRLRQKHVDGRHAKKIELESVSAEADAHRRDFTFNGLFYDPIEGKIIDYVGGYEDLKNNIIKFTDIPEKSIGDDQMRLIRWYRFKEGMGFAADEESEQAVKNWFGDEEKREKFKKMFCLNQRLKPELEKILKNKNRVKILEAMMEDDVIELILPEIARMKGVEQPKEFHSEGDVWEHTKKCLENLPEDASLELIWAALLHDAGKTETQVLPEENGAGRITFHGHEKFSVEIAKYILSSEKEAKKQKRQGNKGLNEAGEKVKGLNYPEAVRGKILWLVGNHMHYQDFSEMKVSTKEKLMSNPYFEELLALWKADALSSVPDEKDPQKAEEWQLADYKKAAEIWENYKKEKDMNSAEEEFPQIFNSEEIMDALGKSELGIDKRSGYATVGEFKISNIIILTKEYIENILRDEKEKERIKTKEDAEELIKNLFTAEFIKDAENYIKNSEEIVKIKKSLEGAGAKEKKSLLKGLSHKTSGLFADFFNEKLYDKGKVKIAVE